MREVVIVDVARTAIGKYAGAMAELSARELGAAAISGLLKRTGLDAGKIDHVIMGCVLQNGPNAYVARTSALTAGIPDTVPALTVNRLCGSALEAINQAARLIQCGEADVCVAGGVEQMSGAPYFVPTGRWGARMGDTTMVDSMVSVLTDPFHNYHMGCTAENVAKKHAISREEQDEFALRSQTLTAAAVEKGYFDSQIVPVEITVKKEKIAFDKDEGVRKSITIEDLKKLKPAFEKGGTVTPGNSSTINDAASVAMLMEKDVAKALGLVPMCKMVSWAVAGLDPAYMGLGPALAVPKALAKAKLSLNDIDVHELNEAFAAQALGVLRELKLECDRVNPNGGAISLGHPIGATGAILMGKVANELVRTKKEWGMVSMCIGGGQGIATIVQRI